MTHSYLKHDAFICFTFRRPFRDSSLPVSTSSSPAQSFPCPDSSSLKTGKVIPISRLVFLRLNIVFPRKVFPMSRLVSPLVSESPPPLVLGLYRAFFLGCIELFPMSRLVSPRVSDLMTSHGEVGGWGRVPFSRNLMSPTPRRK